MLNMGRMQDAKMLKVVEQEQEEVNEKEEASTGIPKPSFLANLAIQQLNNMSECPVPRKKKAKKTVRFTLSTVAKRKLEMEEEEEEGMSSLKRSKEEKFLAEELEQIGFMMTNMLASGKK